MLSCCPLCVGIGVLFVVAMRAVLCAVSDFREAEMLIRIAAPHFVAGVVLDEQTRVIRTAPILHYMRDWSLPRIITYCIVKQWQCAICTDLAIVVR